MPDHIIVKLLTASSDLGWYKSLFYARNNQTKQKGIAMDARLLKRLYTGIAPREELYAEWLGRRDAARARGDRAGVAAARIEMRRAHVPVVVNTYGPAGAPPFARNRLIVRQKGNWRLDGKFLDDPDIPYDHANPVRPDRFTVLQEGDLALIGLDGIEEPTAATVLLIANRPERSLDAALHAALGVGLRRQVRASREVPHAELEALANRLGLPDDHAVRLLAREGDLERDLEEEARGNRAAGRRLRTRRRRVTTAEELAAAREAAERTGRLGEEILNAWLPGQAGYVGHRWVAETDITAPYDFEILSAAGTVTERVDAKSTKSAFGTDFFMSSAEVACAADSTVPYRVFRLSEVGPTGAFGRLSGDIRGLAAAIIASADAMPRGVRPSTFAITPDDASLTWGPRVRLPPLVPPAPDDGPLDEDEDDDE